MCCVLAAFIDMLLLCKDANTARIFSALVDAAATSMTTSAWTHFRWTLAQGFRMLWGCTTTWPQPSTSV